MKLFELTNENMILLDASAKTKDEVIKQLVQVLYDNGKISSVEGFLEAIYERESISETGIENGFAIPHGKSDCVREAAFAVMTTKDVVSDWESLDPDNEVKHIIMLAIPKSEGGSTHLDLLATLMERMSDEDYANALFASKTPKELFEKLDAVQEKEEKNIEYTKSIVAVTACPAGIAHTYMAAQALVKAGEEMGVKVYVEKQGANGIEDRHTAENLQKADAAIFAVEVAVKDVERFSHLASVKVPVAEPIKKGKEVIQKALEKAETFEKGEYVASANDGEEKESLTKVIKQSVLTGISYMIPIIVAGGMIGAFAVLVSNVFGLDDLYKLEGSWLWLFRNLGSGLLGTLLVPVMAAYMAYSISDKTALAPGFAAGLAANLIGGGFLAGMFGGLVAGFLVKLIKKYIPARGTLAGFVSFLVYPVLSTLGVGIVMFLIIGEPIAWLNTTLIEFLNSLSGTNAALLGAIIGVMVSFDLGGPINKASYAFCAGALAEGVIVPYAIFASVKMVSGFAVTMATMVAKDKFTEEEKDAGKTSWILVLGGITEGAIPFMMADPIRVIISLCTGSAVTGMLVAIADLGLDVPGAGIFSIFMIKQVDPLWGAFVWVGAAVIGAIISAFLLVVLRNLKIKKMKRKGKL